MTARRKKLGGCLKSFIIFFSVILSIALVCGILVVIYYLNSLPTLEELTPSPIAQTSKVYSLDGSLITEFHAEENREIISFDHMSQSIKDATVALEDKRFYDHQGVDYRRIVGALIADIRTGTLEQGAGTITMQYVRNIYFSLEKTWRRKINEALIAIQIERNYTKDKILEMYLNTVNFGTGSYGVEKAAETYFGVDAADLTVPQAALLAGLLQAPEVYSPFNSMENAKYRRDQVLKMMYEQGYIDSDQYIDSLAAPIIINENPVPATQFSSRIAPYFVDYVKQQLYEREFTDYDVFKGGLRIYTTLDINLQEKAEQSVKTVFPEDIGPSYSLICTDPSNGYIYSLIGGKDYNTSKFNIATQGKRQPGSVFKVFVLSESVRQNMSAKNEFNPDGPLTIDMEEGPDWIVNNYGNASYGEKMSVVDATIHSVNVVYAQLMMKVGAQNVENLCEDLEIYDIGSNPAIALGGLETGITPLDVSKLFSTLASGGVYRKPVSILKITDPEGNILYQYEPEEEGANIRIMKEPHAYYITSILERVIGEGTGMGANIGRPAAGKTGTTSDYKDAWFAGYTPDLVTVVWMGHLESGQAMEPINAKVVVGGTYPADIWREFMTSALEDRPVNDFEAPQKELVDVQVCTESGLLPVFWCPEELLTWNIYIEDEQPEEVCDVHNKVTIPDVIGMPVEEAHEIFEEMYTEVTEVQEFNDTFNENIVFDQSPEAGSILESLTGEKLSVILYISKGLKKFHMPNIVGLDLEEARGILKKKDLILSDIVYEFDLEDNIDMVFKQSPPAESMVTKSTPVTLYISKGENPEGTVPDVIGLTELEAVDKLNLAGFENIDIMPEESQEEMGLILDQVPESGTVYTKLSKIIISISLGIQVPDLMGLDKDDAVDLLDDLGFTIEIMPDPDADGKVIDQMPSALEYLDYGSIVIIEIENGNEEEAEE